MHKYILCFFSIFLLSNSNLAYSNEQQTIAAFKKVSPRVVLVRKVGTKIDSAQHGVNIQISAGSGFIWNDQGYIVTNFHVIYRAPQIAVSIGKTTVRARVIDVDPSKDIAIIKVDNDHVLKIIRKMPPLELGNSSKLQIGQTAIAIGNPFGLTRTMTKGIISALNRSMAGFANSKLTNLIQTDAAINPGNSGGPLVDSQGKVIGMNIAIFTKSGRSSGLGFAIPINDIKQIIDKIKKN